MVLDAGAAATSRRRTSIWCWRPTTAGASGFVDPRRFGSVDLVPTRAGGRAPAAGGAWAGAAGRRRSRRPACRPSLAGKRTPIKAALLDQKVVAGLGNIYVCEALFRARHQPAALGPHHPGHARGAAGAGDQGDADARRSPPAARSLRDYVQPDGELGYFQHAWKVYGREGEPCERCPGTPACPGIRRITQSGRSTFYCPRTQR